MKIQTLERYVRHTAIPYGDLLARAEKGGLEVVKEPDGTVIVNEPLTSRQMVMFFESAKVYEENRDNGLIKTEYNYSR